MSFGSDKVSGYFLDLAIPFLERSLASYLKHLLRQSYSLESWKHARITSIFKEGDRAKKSTYRLISVLHVISKLFEKPVIKQLYQYVIKK